MPLSTSSFSKRLIPDYSKTSLLIGGLLAFSILFLIECGLALHNFQSLNPDTKELWAAQRVRASALGDKALILVGASRIQLGLDLNLLESELALKPIQLAIDGTYNIPILEDLASDPSITGTILVSLGTGAITPNSQQFKSNEWLNFYKQEFRGLLSPVVEKNLKDKVRDISNIYSSGLPLPHLIDYALGRKPAPKYYLVTSSLRERNADYTMVDLPIFYIQRAIRHLGEDVNMIGVKYMKDAIQRIRSAIPVVEHNMRQQSDFKYINTLSEKLAKKGCRVIYIRFPTSGLVWEIDQAKRPKKYFWDQFRTYSIAPTIHFMDYPELQYVLPDGSHLDKSQKSQFTGSLAKIIKHKLNTIEPKISL